MRRNVADRLGELKVVLVIEPLILGQLFVLRGAELAAVPQHDPGGGADVGRLGDHLGQNVLRALQDFFRRVQALLRVDQRRQHLGEVGDRGVAVPHRQASGSRPLSRASLARVFFLGL